jgi:hypothetical protein
MREIINQTIYTIFTILLLSMLSGCGGSGDGDTNETTTLYSTVNHDEIKLSWDIDEEAIAYDIEWSTDRDELSHIKQIDKSQTEYLHRKLHYSTMYYYRLRVELSGDAEDKYSDVISIKTGDEIRHIQMDTGN